MRRYLFYLLVSTICIGIFVAINSKWTSQEKFAVIHNGELVAPINAIPLKTDEINNQESKDLTEMVTKTLLEIQKIEVGMTRADLLKIFTTEGGLSTGTRRTYVYKQCGYIKVDVEFEPVGRPVRNSEGRVTLKEANEDLIKKISKPYLQWGVQD